MAKLYDKDTGALLGEITDDELQFLADQLEEEDEEDTDYYLNADTVEMLAEAGAPSPLLDLLRRAIGEKSEVEIRWSRE
jgi:processive 1,2-diacylglycerol beta-glucosyltransferase